MSTDRAASYLRLSELTDNTTSPDRQREACVAFIAAKGWTYDPASDGYEDWDRSAFNGRARPDFERLLKRIAAGQYAHLVVYRLDRLSRSFVHWGRVFEACKDGGAVIHSATENIDSASAAPVFGILAGLAWSESSTISARVKNTRTKQFREGHWPGGNRPFGWSPVPHPSGKGRSLALYEEEAQHLRDAVDRVIAGESVRSIVARLNAHGVTTTSGASWHPSRLVAQLRNPLLKGYRTERGEVVVDEHQMPVIYYPALIDAAKFEQLQQALKERSRPAPGGLKSLLSGVLRCGVCGGPMSGRGGVAPPLAVYNCSTRAARGAGVCPGVAIRQSRLDETVTEWVVVRAEGLTSFLSGADDEEVPPEVAEIAEATAQVERWQELYVGKELKRERYDEKVAPLRNIIAAAQAKLDAREQSPRERLRTALEGRSTEDVLTHFAELPRRQQRQVVAGIFSNVWIAPPASGRGMKGVPRAERWEVSLRERVTVELTRWPGREFSAEEWHGELVMPLGVEEGDEGHDEALEMYLRAMASDNT